MATFKAEVQNKRADGTYNVRIRVTHNRQVRRMSTNIYAKQNDLTKGLKIKSPDIINASNKLINQCITICNELSFSIVSMGIDDLVEALKFKLKGEDRFKLDFIEFAREEIVNMKQGTAYVYTATISALIRFMNQDRIDISRIDTEFLRKFEAFIENEPSQCGSNRKSTKATPKPATKGRAVSAYLTCVRAIFNRARDKYNDEDRGFIRIPHYPFKKFKIKPEPLTRKRALTIEQIQSIINLPYETADGRRSRHDLAKDCFIISFALMGMNSADLYHCAPAKSGIITYNRQKTKDRRGDSAEMKIKIEGCIQPLIDKYSRRGDEYLFVFCRQYSDMKSFNKAINKGLKQIGEKIGIENLQYYAARHSWATIAQSKAVGIEKTKVHEALCHVDENMKMTDIYTERDWSVIWEANKKVLALFDWSFFLVS